VDTVTGHLVPVTKLRSFQTVSVSAGFGWIGEHADKGKMTMIEIKVFFIDMYSFIENYSAN
jgi:hypothetical protein